MFASESLVCWVWKPTWGLHGAAVQIMMGDVLAFLIHAETVSLQYDFEIL